MTMTSTTTARSAPLARDEVGRLLGQTMGLVALTAGLFALGAYVGRDTSGGWAIFWFVAALGVLLAMNAAAQRSEQLTAGLLFGFGLLLGLACAPTLPYYLGTDPQAVWEAGRSDSAVRSGIRCRRLRDAARPLGARAILLLGAGRADRVWDRARVRADPGRRARLRDRRSRDLRRADRI